MLRFALQFQGSGMRTHGLLLVVLAAMLWGTDSLFRRPLTRSLSPVTIVFLEHLVLVLVMLPSLARSAAVLRSLGRRDWIALSFIALGGSVAATSLFTFAIKHGNPSVAALLQKTQPIFTLLLARWLLGERPGRWFWFCLPPAVAGAYLIAAPDWREAFAFDLQQPGTTLAAVGAAALWGSSTVFGRYVVTRVPALVLTGLRFAIALPMLALLFVIQPHSDRGLPVTLDESFSIIAMALIPGLLALIFYYHGLRSTPASLASIGELAFPITAVTANWYLLGSRLTASQIIGACILVAAVTLLTLRGSTSSAPSRERPKGDTPGGCAA
jgi:drug/metabolite transporter, DME family